MNTVRRSTEQETKKITLKFFGFCKFSVLKKNYDALFFSLLKPNNKKTRMQAGKLNCKSKINFFDNSNKLIL